MCVRKVPKQFDLLFELPLTSTTNLGSVKKEEYPVKMVTTNDPEKQVVETISERGRKFTMFDVKMILIGSAALMFSKITGRPNSKKSRLDRKISSSQHHTGNILLMI